MTKSISFEERTDKQHKNRMSHLLCRIRKNCNFTDRDYDDIAMYCKDVDGITTTGVAYKKRLVKAVKSANKDEEVPNDWI